MICIKCKKEVPDGPFCCQCGSQQIKVRSGRSRGNGTGNAYKRGKTWTGRSAGYSYWEKQSDGSMRLVRKRPTKGGFRTKTEALEWASSKAADASIKVPVMIDLWNGYKDSEFDKLSKDRKIGYSKARERLERIMSRRIDTLTIDELQEVVNDEGKSYYTARDMKTVLSKMYQRAMMGGGCGGAVTVNIAKFIVLPELKEEEPEPFTEEEVSKMWKSWDEGNLFVGYMLLMIYTSMMPGEVMKCEKEMINYEKKEIYGCGIKTKKRKEVPVVFPDFIAPVLQKLSESSTSIKGRIFGGEEDKFYEKYHEATKIAGVRDLAPYSCRHTTATEVVKKGVELPVVQQIMRHSKLSSTQRYIHISTGAAHDAINSLQRDK